MRDDKDTLLYRFVSILSIIGYTAIIVGVLACIYGASLYMYRTIDTSSWPYKMWTVGTFAAIIYSLGALWNWAIRGLEGY